MGKARGKQQGGGFSQNSAHGQDAAGEDAVDAAGQHHRAHHPPLACPQSEGALPVGLGHGFQAFLRVSQDGGQVHDGQCQAACHQTGADGIREHQHTHQTVDDGGDPAERLRRVFDDGNDSFVSGVFRQVHRRPRAQRDDDQQGDDDDVHRVQNIRQDSDMPA